MHSVSLSIFFLNKMFQESLNIVDLIKFAKVKAKHVLKTTYVVEFCSLRSTSQESVPVDTQRRFNCH